MQFADLTDTLFSFQCQPSEDRCQHWEYDFSVETWDDKYRRNLSKTEVIYLKENCERILQILNNIPRRVK